MNSIDRQKADPGKFAACKAWPLFHRVLTANPFAIREALSDVRNRFTKSANPDTIGRLELVLAEVLNNVAEHAVPRHGNLPAKDVPTIHLSIVRTERGFVCAVADDGISLPDKCLQPHSLPKTENSGLSESGFGWFLIQDLTQTLCYYREEQKNYLAFSVPLTQSA
ncbi:ATP-binding protein [Paracoccus saliphilus]|uniref:ATP-binding protein n=1 Tax=Paracoccus saliphilus TaxID=405559 RepID=A0AA45W169_9RHOB|nr:ATP-binding protein [Paracoccus saliphilus]WCR03496.1 ATP-binding protein [Paracoccus saliphilus]SIS54722.1 serine/threonine-protein kinase RsbW [Paracoccus saliphilus]